MIFRTLPIPQLFAEGKSLKSEGIGMPRDKNKGIHGSGPCNVEPIMLKTTFSRIEFLDSFWLN
jgi:hypothetical protein